MVRDVRREGRTAGGAAGDEYSAIPAERLCAMAPRGRDPKKPEHRRILCLPEIIETTVTRDRKGRFLKRP